MSDMKSKPDDYWRRKLTPEQYHVLREKGTEVPGTGRYLSENAKGVYSCAACGQELFTSDTKFGSRMPPGWPAFAAEAAQGRVELVPDNRYGLQRTEIICANCVSHLGHLFEGDPDSATGKHYCVNSVALDFKQQ